MKARKSKEFLNHIINSDTAFNFDLQSKDFLSADEYERLLIAIMQNTTGKKCLLECAKKFSREFPMLVALSDKNVDDERIVKIFRNVLSRNIGNNKNSSFALYAYVAEPFVASINDDKNIVDNREILSSEILLSDSDKYAAAIKVLSDIMHLEDIVWFFKVTGNTPNEKQMDIIQSIIKQNNEKKQNNENIRHIASELISPVAEREECLEKRLEIISEDIKKIENISVAYQFEIERLKSKLEVSIGQISDNSNQFSETKQSIDAICGQVKTMNQTVKVLKERLTEQESKYDKTLIEVKSKYQVLTENIKITSQTIAECNNVYNHLNEKNDVLLNDINELRLKLEESEKKHAVSLNCNLGVITDTPIIYAVNCEQCGFDEFADELEDSFKDCNITCDAHYITSIISAGFHPLFVGYSARETAVALSVALTGETPTIVSLPADYTNIAELESICCNPDANVILVEDCIGALREKMLYPIFRKLKQMKQKPYLFLLCESNEELEFVSKSFFLHTTIVQCNDIDAFVDHSKITSCSLRDAMNHLKELQEYKDNSRRLKKFFDNSDLRDSYAKIKSTLFRYYHQGSIGYAVSKLIKNEIRYISDDADELENKIGAKK